MEEDTLLKLTKKYYLVFLLMLGIQIYQNSLVGFGALLGYFNFMVVCYRFFHKPITIFTLNKIPMIISHHWILFVLTMVFAVFSISYNKSTPLELAFLILRILFPTFIAYSIVIIHEFGHSFTAQYFGYKVKSVTIYPFSGVALIEDDFGNDPKEEFWITVNGPLTNFFMALFALAFFDLTNTFCFMFFEINVLMLALNLLPIFPMDGGRLARSLLRHWTNHERATILVSNGSLAIAVLLTPVLWLYWNPLVAGIILFFALVGQAEKHLLFKRRSIEKRLKEIDKELSLILERNGLDGSGLNFDERKKLIDDYFDSLSKKRLT